MEQKEENSQKQSKLDIGNQVKSYRLSKKTFDLEIKDADEDLEKVVPLDNYRIFTYFDSGKIRVLDAKKEGQVLNGDGTPIQEKYNYENPDIIRCPFAYDDEFVCYVNTINQRLQWFSTETFEFDDRNVTPLIPTELAFNKTDREDPEKLENLYRDGLDLVYLKEKKYIVVCEQKMVVNQNDPKIILTVLQEYQSKILFQTCFDYPNLRQMFFCNLNDLDTMGCWTQTFSNQPIQFTVWKLGEPVFDQELTTPIDGNIFEICQWEGNRAVIFGNYNIANSPFMKICDISKERVQEQEINMDLFGESDADAWLMSDFFLCKYELQKIIWERKCEKGTFLDIYNPHYNEVAFSVQIEDNDVEEDDEDQYKVSDLEKIASPNGKYLLGYTEDVPSNDGQPKKYPFVINSIVGRGATVLYLLKQSNLYDKYGEEFCQSILDMLLNKTN